MSDIHDRIERLESLVEQQQEIIDEQRERIDELEAEGTSPLSVSRRTALKTGGLLALLGGGSQAAAADPSGHLGNSNDPLTTVYTEQLAGGLTGGQTVDDLLGTGLSTESAGGGTALRAAIADSDDDGLLEPTDASTDGIDITEVHAGTVLDSGGDIHLRLRNGGPLQAVQPLDVDGNAVFDSGTPAVEFDGNANTTIPTGQTLSVDGSFTQSTTVVSSDYTTSGESRLAVETGGGPVTVTLASADAVDGRRLTIVDKGANAGTNPITVETEGSETINPGGVGSKQIGLDGGRLVLDNIAGDWYTNRNAERDSLEITGGPRLQSGDYEHITAATSGAVDYTIDVSQPAFDADTWYVLVNTSNIACLDVNPLYLDNYESLHITYAVEMLYAETANETGTVRALVNSTGLPKTEISLSNSRQFNLASSLSDPVTPNGQGTFRLQIEGKTTGGKLTYRGANTIHLWGKIA